MSDKYTDSDRDLLDLPEEPEMRGATSEEVFEGIDHVNGRPVTHDSSIQLDDGSGKNREIGTAATRIDDMGRVRVPNRKYDGFKTRGHWGQDGIYYEYFITESEIQEPIEGLANVVLNGDWSVDISEDASSDVKGFAEWCEEWLWGLEGGFDRYIESAATYVPVYGCQPYEVVWNNPDEDGRRHPVKLALRECNTIEKWLTDQSATEPLGIHFKSTDEDYVLTTKGEDLVSYKLVVPARMNYGANFSGVSKIRPIIVWEKLKRTLAQILGVGSEFHSMPIRKVMEEGLEEGSTSAEKKKKIFKALKQARAIDASTFSLPEGVDIDIESASGGMAPLISYLEYIDNQLQRPTDSQGKSIPGSGGGSYALREVEDEAMRGKARILGRRIARPINRLMQVMADRFLEDPDEYPTLTLSYEVTRDSSQWVKDVRETIPNWQEYPDIREQVLEALELSPDALQNRDPLEAEEPAEDPSDAPESPSSDEQGSEDPATQ